MRLQVEITTASRTSALAVSLPRELARLGSVNASRSRSATGAVLWEMPSASSSLMPVPAPAACCRLGSRACPGSRCPAGSRSGMARRSLRTLVQLAQPALHALRRSAMIAT